MITPGEGVPCSRPAVSHLVTSPAPPANAPARGIIIETAPRTAVLIYQEWGWPVTQRGDQVWLGLDRDIVGLLIPAPLATEATAILSRWCCPPAVIVHPDAPEHQVFLVGEPFEVALGWPTGVHRTTSGILLPPTVTPGGPVRWMRPPRPELPRQCREIDVCAALRTAQADPHRHQPHAVWPAR